MATLLFIPGLLLTPRLFDEQVAALRGRFDIAFADTLGMSSITAMAEKALAGHEDGDLVPIGLSMGGYVALEIARLAPERLAGLVVMDSNASTDSPSRRAERQRLIDMSGTGKFRGVTKTLLAQFVAEASLDDETVTRPVMAMAEEVGRDNFLLQQEAIMGRRDQFGTLEALECPCLFLVGAEDAPFLEPVRRMADTVGDGTYVEIEGAGHLPTIEQPDAVNAALSEFLQRTGAEPTGRGQSA